MAVSKKITHLTVLNPAIHTRIFYKLARSQQDMGYTVSIIGQDAAHAPYEQAGIHIIPTGKFNRLTFKRFVAGFRILRLAWKEKADAFCIHTPELLWVGLLLKWGRRARLLYDMHEDYRATLLHAQHYPAWLRRPLAALIRGWERISMRWIDGLSYAELSYDNVLGAAEGKYVVLRNTFQEVDMPDEEPAEQGYMLYTGTLAADWGIWETIDCWEKFNAIRPVRLIMAGFSFDPLFVRQIRDRIEQSVFADRFQLIGGSDYVSYAHMVKLIQHCSFGTAFYRLKPHIIGKVPTKFYEYMAFDKPLLFTKEPFWDDFDEKYKLGISLSGNENAAKLLQLLDSWEAKHAPADYAWAYDKLRMQQWLQQVLPLS